MTTRHLPLALLLLALCTAQGGAAPHFDTFVERVAVGLDLDGPPSGLGPDGWPADLFAPAVLDTAWLEAAAAVLAAPDSGALGALLEWDWQDFDAAAWRADARRELAGLLAGTLDLSAPAPICGETTAATLSFFGALAAGDTAAARGLAGLRATRDDLAYPERIAWSLRAAALAPESPENPVWADLDRWLRGGDVAPIGPPDAGQAWGLAVAMRRGRDQSVLPPDADNAHGRALVALGRSRLVAGEIEGSPYDGDVQAALGAVSLGGAALRRHLALHPDPPDDYGLQAAWLRGQRRALKGDPAGYEKLARRTDLNSYLRVDLWRRASERRVMAGNWPAALADLDSALAVAARRQVGGNTFNRTVIWSEQALAMAVMRKRWTEADHILDTAPLSDRAAAHWHHVVSGDAPDTVGDDAHPVAKAGFRVRAGLAAAADPASATHREALVAAAAARSWEAWARWGMALATKAGIPPERRGEAGQYADALSRAAAGGHHPDTCLAVALDRLAAHPEFAAWSLNTALDREVRGRGGDFFPARGPSARSLGLTSEADRHALIGVLMYAGDPRGLHRLAANLDGAGLTGTEKLHFLYPLPGPGPLLDALLAADNEPALLLAIARNESAFEPAVRSRSGALGWMQLMPFHLPARGAVPGAEHWSNPARSVALADALVTENRRRYAGDPYRLLAAYNAGPGSADRWDEQLGPGATREIYLAWIGYTETRGYVEKVLIDRHIYDWILSGAAGE